MGPEGRVLKALEDFEDCASFMVGVAEGKDPSDYRRDRLFRQATERNLEIIGEAIGRIARHDAATASRTSEHRRIIALRNRLIHGYDLLAPRLSPGCTPRILAAEEERIPEADRPARAERARPPLANPRVRTDRPSPCGVLAP